jgi:hypothetical protein
MDQNTIQKLIKIPKTKKLLFINMAQGKRVLLVHGWSDVVLSCSKLQMNLKTRILNNSFDAPAHGKSPKQQSWSIL